MDNIRIYSSEEELSGATGSRPLPSHACELIVPYSDYEIVVLLGHNNEFIGVKEIRLSRNFLSLSQIRDNVRSIDVSDLYEDDI